MAEYKIPGQNLSYWLPDEGVAYRNAPGTGSEGVTVRQGNTLYQLPMNQYQGDYWSLPALQSPGEMVKALQQLNPALYNDRGNFSPVINWNEFQQKLSQTTGNPSYTQGVSATNPNAPTITSSTGQNLTPQAPTYSESSINPTNAQFPTQILPTGPATTQPASQPIPGFQGGIPIEQTAAQRAAAIAASGQQPVPQGTPLQTTPGQTPGGVGGVGGMGSPALSAQPERTALQTLVDNFNTEAKRVQDAIMRIQSGAVPLTSSQAAQLDGLRAQFDTLIAKQERANKSAQNAAILRGYATGSAEYDNFFNVRTIGSIMSEGQQKIADLQVKEAAAIAELTNAFHADDISAVREAWNVYKESYNETRDQIESTIKETTAAIAKAEKDYYDHVTAPIQDIESTAAKNSAPSWVLSNIARATTVDEALQAAGIWIQDASGDVGDYLDYQRITTAQGGVPVGYQTFLAAQKIVSSDKVPSGATSSYTFTATQKNKGAANAGVSLTDFALLPPDVQNFYVNLSPSAAQSLKDTLANIKTGAMSPNEVVDYIRAKGVAPEVEAYLVSLVDNSTPPEKKSLLTTWEDVLRWSQGIPDLNPIGATVNAIKAFL